MGEKRQDTDCAVLEGTDALGLAPCTGRDARTSNPLRLSGDRRDFSLIPQAVGCCAAQHAPPWEKGSFWVTRLMKGAAAPSCSSWGVCGWGCVGHSNYCSLGALSGMSGNLCPDLFPFPASPHCDSSSQQLRHAIFSRWGSLFCIYFICPLQRRCRNLSCFELNHLVSKFLQPQTKQEK